MDRGSTTECGQQPHGTNPWPQFFGLHSFSRGVVEACFKQSGGASASAPARFSGGVTSNAGVDWLNKQATTVDDLTPLGIEFRSFEHSGDLDLDRYCRYASAVETDLARLAIVSEDETAFGGEYGSGSADNSPCRPKSPDAKPHQGPVNEGQSNKNQPNRGPVHLYYPRDISALRAAYQNQSIFTGRHRRIQIRRAVRYRVTLLTLRKTRHSSCLQRQPDRTFPGG